MSAFVIPDLAEENPHYLKRFNKTLVFVVLTVLYLLAGKLGLSLAFIHVSASAIWPPTGIAIAGLLVLGWRYWPAIFIGAFITNLTTVGTIWTSLGIASGNTLEALVAFYLVNKYADGIHAFESPGGLFRFAILAGVVSTLVSASIGAGTLLAGGLAQMAELQGIWLTWWLGDLGGAIVIAPFLILLATTRIARWDYRRATDVFLLFFFLILISVIVFWGVLPEVWNHSPLSFLALLPLIAMAFKMERAETAGAIVVLAFISTWGTLSGLGPFALESVNESLAVLQVFLATTAFSALTFAILVYRRRMGERVVATSERYFRSLIENSSDAVALIDARGQILYLSPSVKRILGYEPDKYVGLVGWGIICPPDRERAKKVLKKLVSGKSKSAEVVGELRVNHANGVLRWVECTLTNLLSEPAVRAVVVNFRDITERKEMQIAKNRFVSTISYRLRPPLTQIGSYLNAILVDKRGLDPLTRKYLTEAGQSAKTMTTLVNDLLKLMRIELGTMNTEPIVVDLRQAMNSTIHDFAHKMNAGRQTIKKNFSSTRVLSKLDPSLLGTLLHRLMIWSLEFAGEGAVIRVEVVEAGKKCSVQLSYLNHPVDKRFLSNKKRGALPDASGNRKDLEEENVLAFEFSTLQALTKLMDGEISFEQTKTGRGIFSISFPKVKENSKKH